MLTPNTDDPALTAALAAHALSPLDGRYAKLAAPLRDHLSEWGLMKRRILVEAEWLIFLADEPGIAELRALGEEEQRIVRRLASEFDDEAMAAIKAHESRTNHDLKAVELYMRDRLTEAGLGETTNFLHFACTSEDVNNLSYALVLRDGVTEVWRPALVELIELVEAMAGDASALPMLSLTHGQPATPTTFGKEMAVFAARLRRQLGLLDGQEYLGKLNGAVGTYAAHLSAYPELAWDDLSRRFVESLGLTWAPLTTQIEAHDWIGELFGAIARANGIVLDLDRDMWSYVSRRYLRQRVVPGEVGSSTMPHKVNPIAFENAEANAGLSTAIATHMATTLATSRLQRDLSDSSLLRNCGAVVGHSLLALKSTARGLRTVEVDPAAMERDLEQAWEVLAEAVQTVMRKNGSEDPYEQVKKVVRGRAIDEAAIRELIEGADLPAEDRERLLAMTPGSYVGLAPQLARLDPGS
ncbi:MAG TPA: adenylosuccinate lyase [Solirubrobacterales bacterium]